MGKRNKLPFIVVGRLPCTDKAGKIIDLSGSVIVRVAACRTRATGQHKCYSKAS